MKEITSLVKMYFKLLVLKVHVMTVILEMTL